MSAIHRYGKAPAARISKRTKAALEVLAAGGFFRKALERHYLGGEKFVTRLYDSRRNVVRGVGVATLYELERMGELQRRECHVGSCWAQEWSRSSE